MTGIPGRRIVRPGNVKGRIHGQDADCRRLDLLTDLECDYWGSVLKAVQHARLGEADAAVEAAAALDRDDLRFLLGMAKRMGPMLRQMETADSAPELTAQADRLALFTGRVKELLAAARR